MPKYLRKVIHIKATDSPNVRLALAEIAQGREPSNEQILPGVIDWSIYQFRRRTLDPVMQCISLDGEFYEGGEVLLFPPDWLNKAEEAATRLPYPRKGRAMGVDTAEGGDKTVWTIIDQQGIIKQISQLTPDTVVITGKTIGLMKEYGVEPECVCFDRGGGGKEHSDRLRYQGYDVQDVHFGEAVNYDPVTWMIPAGERTDRMHERSIYKNRRAQLYWLLHRKIDPGTPENPYPFNDGKPFGFPKEYAELRRQLSVMPTVYDEEGRICMLPKRKKATTTKTKSQPSLEEILGCSPDEADSLVLANFAMEETYSEPEIYSVW